MSAPFRWVLEAPWRCKEHFPYLYLDPGSGAQGLAPVGRGSRVPADSVGLSDALRGPGDQGVVAGSLLKEGLAGTDLQLRLTLNPVTVEDLTRIWSVFPNQNYRVSVSSLVTPVPIDSGSVTSAQRVVEHDSDYDHIDAPPVLEA